MHRRSLTRVLVVLVIAWTAATAQELRLPNKAESLKFAVIGDNGTGEKPQFDVAAQMARFRQMFAYDTVIMLGDNIYGGQGPKDMERKFALPYKPLLDAEVQFYASLGNHDDQGNRNYKYWNMNGERYYSFKKKNVRFFVLDSNFLDQPQRVWIERELAASNDEWKIAYFHHPLYSSAARHGSEVDLRVILEPLFVKYGVNVVFQGHDHVYERLHPQKGIYYFVEGASGQLRRGNLRKSELTAAGNDQDQSFMLVEIDGDTLTFQTIGRSGQIVDGGTIQRAAPPRQAETTTR